MQKLPETFIETAIQAVDQARLITARYFRSELAVDSKSDRSPVTVADQETEQALKNLILDRHPEHGFFGEESGTENTSAPWQWILDPIDGTKSFASGKPTFGTLVALLFENEPLLGIIDHGILDERWIGIKNRPTTFNGQPCATSKTSAVARSSLCVTTPDMFDESAMAAFDQLSCQCQFRVFGGDCHSYGLLASGHTEIVCEADLKAYDYLALVPVVEGAGGVISDWRGDPLNRDSGDRVLASANLSVHREAIQYLRGSHLD
ncbi:MAG: inositol monophosphatase family protein [Pseudomonadota bacterium]